MRRSSARAAAPLLGLLAALSLSACPAKTQAPTAFKWSPDVKPGAYYPLRLDNAWSYNAYDFATGESVLVVNRVQARDGNRAIFATEPSPLAYEDVGDAIVTFPSRKPILKTPVAKGTSWPLEGGGTARIVEVEGAVDTPAGHYDACVSVEESAPDRRIVTTFAPGVGPVKLEIFAREGDKEIPVMRALLRSFHDASAEQN